MKFTIENKIIEHTFIDQANKDESISISWFKSLHGFFKEEYFNNWIHNISISYYYGNIYPLNLHKLFKPLQTDLSKIKVVFLFTGNELNAFSSGIGAGEDRVISVPDNYLNDELIAFKKACIEYRIVSTTSNDCCSITPDFDQSLNYLVKQDVLILNLNSIKTNNVLNTIKLSNYFKPVISEILDSVILTNENLHIISPVDTELSDFTNLKSCLTSNQVYKYTPKNKDSILKAIEEVNLSLYEKNESNSIVKW